MYVLIGMKCNMLVENFRRKQNISINVLDNYCCVSLVVILFLYQNPLCMYEYDCQYNIFLVTL